MTPEQIDRVFGRGRLKMVTGEHVEVFREAVAPGERRRYTKRFLQTTDGDFAHWTEREWRILARLIGHGIGCVPEVVQFDRGSIAGTQLVQTYDAGVTVDQWATLLPLLRDGHLYRHAFEDCAHWWALAHHCLVALKEIHQLQLVHLDIKGDNVCIPFGPANFDPDAPGLRLYPMFGQLALIDFAFALVSRDSLTTPLPIGWQREYDYQSPRLLKALEDGHNGDLRRTRELDWRCDMYSLAAMLKRYLPDEGMVHQSERATGWTGERYDAAKALILTLREHHDREAPQLHPHQALIDATGARLRESDLAPSLASGWTLARDASVAPAGASPLTPMTRLAPPLRVFVSPHERWSTDTQPVIVTPRDTHVPLLITKRNDTVRPAARRAGYAAIASAVILALGAVGASALFPEATRTVVESSRMWLDSTKAQFDSLPSAASTGKSHREEAPAAAAAKVAEALPGANAAPAAALPDSTAAPNPVPDTQSATTDHQVEAPPAKQSPESGGALAALPNRRLDPPPLPSTSRMSPKAALAATAVARAPGKRLPTNSAALSPARSSKPVASAKSRASLSPASSSRLALQAQRASPARIGSRSSASPDRSSEQAARGESPPAPTHVAQPASPPSEALPPMPPSSPPPQPPAEVSATPGPAVSQEPQPQSMQESRASAAPISPPVARQGHAPSANDGRRTQVGVLSQLFQLAQRIPAPIEDRRSQVATAPNKEFRTQQTPSPIQERAPASPKVNEPPSARSTISTEPAYVQVNPQSSQPSPPQPPTSRDEWRPQSPPAINEQRSPPQAPVPEEPKPWGPEEMRVPVPPSWSPAPRVISPSQAVPVATPGYGSTDRARANDFAMHARRMLAQAVPRTAAQAQNEIAKVLRAAANAHDPKHERAVVDAAQAVWVREDASGSSQAVEPVEATRLYGQALHAYWTRRNVSDAFDLQLKAFGANPHDPEIAGNLAFLHLKVSPLQPEMARQLALHAIAMRGARFRTGRLEDWNTYAVASALTGRDADARNALFVTVALARNVERNCRTALSAMADYGERMREPVEAMLLRIYTQGRAYESPYCAWPPNWSMGARLQ